jgi:hypothetical protein
MTDWLKNRKKTEYTKIIVGWLLLNGTIWTYLSYYLAYLGKEEIAESLSKAVVTEILGVFAAYACKALLENLSKNNLWPDKQKKVKNDEIDIS